PKVIPLAAHAVPAGEDARTGADRFVDLALERIEKIAPSERTDLRLRIHRIAHGEVLDAFREPSLEVVRDRIDDDEALGGDTGLPVVLVPRANCGRRGGVEVRVREND